MNEATVPIQTNNAPSVRRRSALAVPADGEDGLYFQSWYPVALSSELPPGQVISCDFLGGGIVVYRGSSGKIAALSAFCPHLGAHLGVGRVIGDDLQCAFHLWEYNAAGRCTKTGVGDPPPPSACLFRFPAAERFGLIWVFNGTEPLFDLPSFEIGDDSLATYAFVADTYNCDGWVFACNTPDMQHIKAVHGIRFKHDDPHEEVEWNKWGFRYRIAAAHGLGPAIDWQIGITGTSIFSQEGTVDDWWLGAHVAFSCPRPGQHQAFVTINVERGEDSPTAAALAEQRLAAGAKLLSDTAAQDKAILNSIHYVPGTLTKSDRTLVQFLGYLRNFPRAHPSADFIR